MNPIVSLIGPHGCIRTMSVDVCLFEIVKKTLLVVVVVFDNKYILIILIVILILMSITQLPPLGSIIAIRRPNKAP